MDIPKIEAKNIATKARIRVAGIASFIASITGLSVI
jgi:hypothetical protein